MIRITPSHSHALYSVAGTRLFEQHAQASLAPHTLMQRAGLATARLALALAPFARHIWVACGPGNNGGDGFEAALELHQRGRRVSVTWTGNADPRAQLPWDAEQSLARLVQAGVAISPQAPKDFDLAIDALLGLGGRLDPQRAGSALMGQWLAQMQASGQPVLCVDLPTGLDADTGSFSGPVWQAGSPRHTLSLLTLKPGLFTAAGRDQAGQVWFDDLSVPAQSEVLPVAWTSGPEGWPAFRKSTAAHASHKGSFGDVAVIGGVQAKASGTHMMGAALLAARAALHAGAGRVFVGLLGDAELRLDPLQPELMFRHPDALDFQQTVVCGCGGGSAVAATLPRLLSTAARAVLDADALNAIAQDSSLQTLLRARQGRGWATVLTPHPLEAARLLPGSAQDVQARRLEVAQDLADRLGCVVVLKGSGTVLASPGQTPVINLTGNAMLATAGTGDVLAGMVGAQLAAGQDAWTAARQAVFRHGELADQWASRRPGEVLTASRLAQGAVNF